MRLCWTEDGRRVYFDDDGEEVNPYRGMSSASSASANGTPKVQPKALQARISSYHIVLHYIESFSYYTIFYTILHYLVLSYHVRGS